MLLLLLAVQAMMMLLSEHNGAQLAVATVIAEQF
jgi:hypothetical protein